MKVCDECGNACKPVYYSQVYEQHGVSWRKDFCSFECMKSYEVRRCVK